MEGERSSRMSVVRRYPLIVFFVLAYVFSWWPWPLYAFGLSPSPISSVGAAATLCEFALWRHLHRNRDLLLPDIPEGLIVELRTLRLWSLGLFILSILVSLLSPRIAVLLLLALLPLYEFAYHRRRHRHYRILNILRD